MATDIGESMMIIDRENGGESRRDRAFRAWAVVLLGLIEKQEKGELTPDGPQVVQALPRRLRQTERGPAAEA